MDVSMIPFLPALVQRKMRGIARGENAFGIVKRCYLYKLVN